MASYFWALFLMHPFGLITLLLLDPFSSHSPLACYSPHSPLIWMSFFLLPSFDPTSFWSFSCSLLLITFPLAWSHFLIFLLITFPLAWSHFLLIFLLLPSLDHISPHLIPLPFDLVILSVFDLCFSFSWFLFLLLPLFIPLLHYFSFSLSLFLLPLSSTVFFFNFFSFSQKWDLS